MLSLPLIRPTKRSTPSLFGDWSMRIANGYLRVGPSMPIPSYDVTVGRNGRWHSGIELYGTEYEASGEDLQSLFDHLVAKGLVKK